MGLAPLSVAIAALAPWLAMAPLSGVPAVAAHVLALAAAMHGAGLLLARLAGRSDVHPLLAMQWGTAVLIALLGAATAAGQGGIPAQAVLVYGFAAIHTAALVRGFAGYRARLAAARETRRAWLVPVCLLAGLGALHVLGAAGDTGAHPFDDDGHVLAQLERLRQTGALADPIGYARSAQLGGQLSLQALATLGGGVAQLRLAEALAMVLAVGLALARLRPPGAPDTASDAAGGTAGGAAGGTTTGLWALLLVLCAAALTYSRLDPAACWTAVGLIAALYATLADGADAAARGARTSPLPAGVLAGALIALRFELAPLAAAALAAAWWPHRASIRGQLALAAGALAAAGPYLAARILAWETVPAAARAFVAPAAPPLGMQLAIAAGAALACAPIAAATWRRGALRWLGLGAALAIGGAAGQLTGARPYAFTALWPLALAGGLVLAVEIARSRRTTTVALLAALVAGVFIYEGQAMTGRRRWSRRYVALAENLSYLRHAREETPAAPAATSYEPLLRGVPAGATVAVWVMRPERLDYTAHRIVDLRTPRAGWMRQLRPLPFRPPLPALLALVGADLLLYESEGRTDALAAIALGAPLVAEEGSLRLLDLRPERAPAAGSLHHP